MRIINHKLLFIAYKKGFTLVELLFVLAIIATLVALIGFGVSKQREKALMVACQNNLRAHNTMLTQHMLASEAGYAQSAFGTASTVPAGDGVFYIYDSASGVTDSATEAFIKTRGGIEGIKQRSGHRLSAAGTLYGDYLDFEIPQEVRHCPVLKNYTSLVDTNSKSFKGYGQTVTRHLTVGIQAQTVAMTNPYAIDDCIRVTTYALNTSDMNPESVAYVDWNAAEGWGTYSVNYGWHGYLYYTTWQFNNTSKGIIRGESKGTTNWWHTEVGFHHTGGANYVTWGGRGGWVHSNDIALSYFQAQP